MEVDLPASATPTQSPVEGITESSPSPSPLPATTSSSSSSSQLSPIPSWASTPSPPPNQSFTVYLPPTIPSTATTSSTPIHRAGMVKVQIVRLLEMLLQAYPINMLHSFLVELVHPALLVGFENMMMMVNDDEFLTFPISSVIFSFHGL